MLLQFELSYDIAGEEVCQLGFRLCHGGGLHDGELSHDDGIGDNLLLLTQLEPSFVLVCVSASTCFVCTSSCNAFFFLIQDESPD